MSDERDPAADVEGGPFTELSLRTGYALSDLDLPQLWVAYLALGGSMSRAELEDTLAGRRPLSAYEHDLVAQALNDHFTERGQDHPVAYADETEQPHHESPRRRRR